MASILEDAEQNITPRMRCCSTACGRSGSRWRSTSLRSGKRSNAFPTKMLAVNDCARSLESGRWFPRPRSRPLAMAQRFARRASLPLGSDWCRDSTPPGARQALRHQQTRQCVLAPHVHSWRSRCAAASEVRHRRLQWVQQMEARAPCNKVIVAIANKLARIAWAVLFRGVD